ncbi:MAG: hypothetical protein ACOH2A_10425 [Sphingobacteriaceae bacterium]
MKSKKATYFLGFLVLVIWGLILLKVMTSTDDNHTLKTIIAKQIEKAFFNDYAVVDTANLLLHYHDPFGITKEDASKKVEMKQVIRKRFSRTRPAVNLDSVKYAGYIRNSRSKSPIAILTFKGKNLMMKEGETFQQLRLLRNMGDSLKILYMGKVGFIKINAANL